MSRVMKDSGIEWIGEIPEEWECRRIKTLSSVKRGASPRPIDDIKYYDENGKYKWVRISDVTSSNMYLSSAGENLSELGSSLSVKLEPESLFISICATVGKPCITRIKCCIHDGFVYFPELKITYTKWLYQIFNCGECYKGLGKLGTQLNLNTGTVGNIYIPVPTDFEINNILIYLDHKCALIDFIIEKQKLLIEKLKLYKQSLITEAVTNGLDPTVKMKPSGIEWIGDIPEGWEVKRLRYIGSCQNGISKSAEDFGEGYPFVSYGDVYNHIELPMKVNGLVKSSIEDRKKYSVIKGDVFFTRTSETVEEIGLSSTCMDTIEDATFAGFLIRFRPLTGELNRRFSKYYFRSQIHRLFFVKEMNLVTRASLSQELLKKLPILIPSLQEQIQIASYLDAKCLQIDKVINIKQKLINKLSDYKKSLIYECVTGKKEVV